MSQHFDHQIDELKARLLCLGELVEKNVTRAIQAVESVDTDLAWEVIAADMEIDRLEIEVEEECLHVLALYQPVASDMRFVASLLTINKDLERMGDLSVNLAEQAMFLADEPGNTNISLELSVQTKTALDMLRQSLQALINGDSALARSVIDTDDEVDQAHRAMYHDVKQRIQSSPGDAGRLVDLLIASQQLERIADHAVNIAEDAIFLVEGKIVRHLHLSKKASKAAPE